MVDQNIVSAIWDYLLRYDETGNPSFLITAWSLFLGTINHPEDLPDFEVEGYINFTTNEKEQLVATQGIITKENVNVIAKKMLSHLSTYASNAVARSNEYQAKARAVYETSKITLILILTTLNLVQNPIRGTIPEELNIEMEE